MTIDEAIETLETIRKHDEHSSNATKNAVQLGIEALKYVTTLRAHFKGLAIIPLLGETEEVKA